MFTTLLNFCSNELSSFYFDIRKDTIYCDKKYSMKRRSARTLLDILFNVLIRWLAPSLVFTCEEAWKARGNKSSIHLEEFFEIDSKFENVQIFQKWKTIKDIRKVITGALEKKREDKIIGSSLEASINIYVSSKIFSKLQNIDFAEIAITSSASIIESSDFTLGFSTDEVDSVSVDIKKSSGSKCNRCWKILEEVTSSNDICHRCKDAIGSSKD